MTRWDLWTPKQKTAAAAVALTVAAIVVVAAISGGHAHPRRARQPRSRPRPPPPPPWPPGPAPPAKSARPPPPPRTRSTPRSPGPKTRPASPKPKPSPSPPPPPPAAYPAVPSADRGDPTAYAQAFITELLDTRYATQTRTALLAWTESEAAADTLPGVPAAAGQKSLIGSLAYAGLPGAQPTPIPAAADWPSPTSGASQTVTGLTTSVDPAWTSQIAQGWQPTDPLATVIDITGTLTVTAPGHPPARHLFSLSLMLGTALHHPGYGAVAVANWTEAA